MIVSRYCYCRIRTEGLLCGIEQLEHDLLAIVNFLFNVLSQYYGIYLYVSEIFISWFD